MNSSFQLLPPHASAMSWSVDWLLLYMTVITVFFTALIFVLIVYYGLKYRARPGHLAQDIHAPMSLEIAWSVIPLLLCLVMFWWGTRLFISANIPPKGAMKVYVIGKQWMWKIQHTEGKKEINELHVPVGRPVWLVMSSQDVIHDFGLPAFRLKRDVIPGQFSEEWFTPTTVGEYHLFCDQYCGAQHAEMIGKVVVMEEKDYQRWLSGAGGDVPMRQTGEALFTKFNCASCHGPWAPSMAGLYMSQVKLADGRTITADDNYLRRSILNPGADIVDGYNSTTVLMPTFNQTVTAEELDQLVEYIKSLGTAANFGPAFTPVPNGGSTTEMRKPGAGAAPPITRDPQQSVE